MAGLLDLFGIGGSMGAGSGGLLDGLRDRSGMLLGLGAGIAGGNDWSTGIQNGLIGAQRGKLFDADEADRRQKLAGQKQLASFAGQGLDPQTMAMLSSNPEIAQAMALQKLAPKEHKRRFGDVGTDAYGNPVKGWIDESAGTVAPLGGQGMGGGTPPPELADMPPGYNPKEWVKQKHERSQLEAAADQMGFKPGSPERAQFVTSGGKNTAPKVTEDQAKNRQIYHDIAPEAERISQNWEALGTIADEAGRSWGAKVGLDGYVTTPEYQEGRTALRYVIQNSLYSKSGAAASDKEVETTTDSLMPKPGESKESRAAKAARIQTLIEGVKLRAYGGGDAPNSQQSTADWQDAGDGVRIRMKGQ